MKKLLVAALVSVCIIFAYSHAGEKFRHFSGNITYLNNENRSLTVSHKKKELSFFVAGTVIHDDQEISLSELSKGCKVTVTYQKNKRRYIANRVTLKDCKDNIMSDSQ